MSERIEVGDLVIIVRWPHKCLSQEVCPGFPFIVTDIDPLPLRCADCGGLLDAPTAGMKSGMGIPVSWLKKIRPLDEPETVERKEELTA